MLGVLRLAGDLVDLVDVDDAPLALGDVEFPGLKQPHQDVLHIFADVTRFGEGGRVCDGEGNVEDSGEGLGQQGLADAGGADQEDVGLVELDLALPRRGRVDSLVMIVDGDGEGSLGPFLTDDVLVQDRLDLIGRRDLGDGIRDVPLLVLRQDLVAQRNAFVADIDRRAGNELPDRILRLSAERAAEMFVVGHVPAAV
jgi:hypothetical protein